MRKADEMNDLDLDLAKRAADGDAQAAETIVGEHYVPILRLLRHLTRSPEDAEDLVQNTFVVARMKLSSFRGGCTLRTWLHKVAFREYLRWQRRVILRPSQWVREPTLEPWGQQQDAFDLMQALARLPAKQREVFVLHEVHGFDTAEVAEIVSVPQGTVLSRLFHARKALRDRKSVV